MRRLIAWLVTLTLVPASVAAQVEAHPVRWSSRGARASIRAGDTARVALHATIAEFFHVYSTTQPPGGPIRTTVSMDPGGPLSLVGRVRAPSPDVIPDANFGMMSEVYSDSLTFGLTLRSSPAAVAGRSRAAVLVRYQACTTKYCLPPRVDTVGFAILVAARTVR
jgi:hypothetical protein